MTARLALSEALSTIWSSMARAHTCICPLSACCRPPGNGRGSGTARCEVMSLSSCRAREQTRGESTSEGGIFDRQSLPWFGHQKLGGIADIRIAALPGDHNQGGADVETNDVATPGEQPLADGTGCASGIEGGGGGGGIGLVGEQSTYCRPFERFIPQVVIGCHPTHRPSAHSRQAWTSDCRSNLDGLPRTAGPLPPFSRT